MLKAAVEPFEYEKKELKRKLIGGMF